MIIQQQIDHIEDERTKKYIQATINSLGLLGINAGHGSIEATLKENEITYKNIARYKPWANLTGSGFVDVYEYTKDGQTRYASEYSFRTAIDDYITISYVTTKMPAEKDIILIEKLEKIINEFSLTEYTEYKKDDDGSVFRDENGKLVPIGKYWAGKTLDPYFTCWECGRKVHWLDIEDVESSGILAKWEQFQDSYCGC